MIEKKFELLLKISSYIQGKTKFREVFKKILRELKEIINYDNATIFLFSEEREKLIEFVRVGESVDFIKNISFNYGKGLAAWLGEQKKQRFLPSFRINKSDGMHSFILTPMILQGNLRVMINSASSSLKK